MKLAVRLVLAAALAAAWGVGTASSASANDCSDPKRPCASCSVDLRAEDPREIVVCYPT